MGYNAKQLVEHLWPYISSVIDLGSSLLRWRKIWTQDFDASGTVKVPTPVNTTDAATKAYVDAAGLVAMTVEEVDGSPSITSTATLRFDQVDGFVVTNPSGSIARVDLASVPTAALAGPITAAKGGTNIDTSASTGVAIVDAGTWSVDAALDIAKGGTNSTTAGAARTALDVPSNAEAILDTIVDAAGDVIVGTAADTVARKAVGTTAWVLTSDAEASDKLSWLPPYFWGTSRFTRSSATVGTLGVGVIPLKVGTTWRIRPITTALTLDNTGLVANTTYFAYAYDNAGTSTLEYSTTGHTQDTTFGIDTKTADATRTLVGMFRTEGSTPGQFVDSATQRFVISWFNRKAVGGVNAFAATRSTTSSTYVELSSTERVEFVTWANEAVFIASSGGFSNGTLGSQMSAALAFDGTTAEDATSRNDAAVTNSLSGGAATLVKNGLAEGYHYATLLGLTSGGTADWLGSVTVGRRTTLTVGIQG